MFCNDILGPQRKGGDLEVCYINETILEEEEEPEDSGTDQLNLEEENELDDDYHYEEDFWDHIKVLVWWQIISWCVLEIILLISITHYLF